MNNPLKILMADDEKELLDIMASRVMKEGYAVIKAYDGEEAWEKIVKESPDVILLDLTMPKRDGLDVLKQLREKPPSTKWQPVIIVSARGELTDMQKSYALEADHHIVKPCRIEDIMKALKLMIRLIP